MKLAKILMAGTAALTIVSSAALAQQTQTGTVTLVDRISGTVVIEQSQSGTVGAGTGGAAEEFKMKDAAALDAVHAGDRVSFSASQSGGTKTITKIDRK
jgi:Cu/Ag efflux protein CusF